MDEQLSEHIGAPEIPKPSHLYHASPNRNITAFEPRMESVRDPIEGPVVFATPDKAYASMFLVESDDSWTIKGKYGREQPWVAIISDEPRFRAADRGGALYELPTKSFHSDPQRNMADIEWTSKENIVPVNKEDFDSALEAMETAGVEVYFVDKTTFDLMRSAEDHGYSVVEAFRQTDVY